MKITRVPTSAADRDRVRATLRGLPERDVTLPAGASLEPPIPAGAEWVTAAGASIDNGVICYVHGGGFTHRNLPLMNLFAELLSRHTRRPVRVVVYPLAPADPFPAPLESVIASYRELLPHVPPERIVLFSESSGGNLALAAMLALDAAERPAGLVAISPVTDLSLASPSIDANAPTDAGVDRRLLSFLAGQYLAGAPADRAPQSPLFGDLTRMPPLLLAAGDAEALLDDTLRFGEAAAAAGVPTRIDLYDGMPHAFTLTTLDESAPLGRTILARVAEFVFHQSGHPPRP